MNSSAPAVSVLIPSYNYRRYLDEAIGSVMDQTFRDFEIVLVDDGSTDGSLEKAREWEARFPGTIRVFVHDAHRNLGIVRTYEAAIARARGRVAAFLEADDVWHPRNLEKKMEVLEKNPDVGVVYSRYRPFGWRRGVWYWKLYETANACGLPQGRAADLFPVFLKRNPVASFSHFLVRRELLCGIPELRTMRMNNDWWILAHLAGRASFYAVPEFLCYWRIHPSSAAFGRVDRRVLWRLRGFLLRLYGSLEKDPFSGGKMARRRKKNLSKALKFQRKLEKRQWASLLKTMIHPIALMRFLCYIALRNLLFSKKYDSALTAAIGPGARLFS